VTALPTHDTATGRVQQTFTVEFIKVESFIWMMSIVI